jgi:long-chain fatty acid transport protein
MSPVVAYRVNDWLSVGAGPVFLYGKLDQRSAVKNLLPPDSEDGQVRLEAGDWGFGGQFALLVEPTPGTRIGVKYQLPVELEFVDTLSFRKLGTILGPLLEGVAADLDLTVPQFVDVSAYHELTRRWAVMATVSWEDHSEFGDTGVSVRSAAADEPRQLTVSRNFDDTWGIAVGVQYRIADPWLASLGFGYDSSPVSKENRTPDLPLDRQIRVGAGLQWDWRENSTLGLAYEYVDMGDAALDVDGGLLRERLVGRYDPNALHFIALSFVWRFGG